MHPRRPRVSYVELDSLCALFGLERDPAQAARQALQAAGAIEKAISELNERLGRQWDCKVEITVASMPGPPWSARSAPPIRRR